MCSLLQKNHKNCKFNLYCQLYCKFFIDSFDRLIIFDRIYTLSLNTMIRMKAKEEIESLKEIISMLNK